MPETILLLQTNGGLSLDRRPSQHTRNSEIQPNTGTFGLSKKSSKVKKTAVDLRGGVVDLILKIDEVFFNSFSQSIPDVPAFF